MADPNPLTLLVGRQAGHPVTCETYVH